MPTLLGRNADRKKHEYLCWEFYEQGSKQALRSGKWKAVRRLLRTWPIEVYNVSKDISEEVDLSKERPDLVAKFEKMCAEAHAPAKRWKVLGKPKARDAARAEGR